RVRRAADARACAPCRGPVRRRGWFEVIGERDSLEPFAARAVSRADGPCPGTLVAPVAEVNAWRDFGIVWLLRDRELAPGACRFEPGSAGLGHGERPPECPVGIRNVGVM